MSSSATQTSGPQPFVFLTPLLSFKAHSAPQQASVCIDSDSNSVVLATSPVDLHILSLYAEPMLTKVDGNAMEVPCVRISPDRKWAALLRWPNTVQLVELHAGRQAVSYASQLKSLSRTTATELLGFHWLTADVLVLIATSGVEVIQFIRQKNTVKCLKAYSLQVNWFLYLATEGTIVLSSGSPGTAIHCIQFKNGAVHRWPRMDIDMEARTDTIADMASRRLRITPRSTLLCSIYGAVHLIVSDTVGNQTRLHLFLLRDFTCSRLDLCIDVPAHGGPIRINVIDNLLLVSILDDKATYVYDINATRPEVPVATASTIASLEVPLSRDTQCSDVIDPYSEQWQAFCSDAIYSVDSGFVCRMLVNVENIMRAFAGSTVDLFGFLLRRSGTTYLVLDVLKQLIVEGTVSSALALVFDQANKVICGPLSALHPDNLSRPLPEPVALKPRMESRIANSLSAFPAASTFNEVHASVSNLAALGEYHDSSAGSPGTGQWSVPSQLEIYTYVLQPLFASRQVSDTALVIAITEYVSSLARHGIHQEKCIYELLAQSMIRDGQHRQLHQLIRHRLIPDTERVAHLLLDQADSTHDRQYWQLAADMLARLQLHDILIQSMLARRLILEAIVYVRDNSLLRTVSPRPFLQAAMDTGDVRLFYNAYRFFEQRNLFLFNNIRFPKADKCDVYERHFSELLLRRRPA